MELTNSAINFYETLINTRRVHSVSRLQKCGFDGMIER
jgi:hypothetical protein